MNRRSLFGKLFAFAAGLIGVKAVKAETPQASAAEIYQAIAEVDKHIPDKLIVGGVRRGRETMLDMSLPEHRGWILCKNLDCKICGSCIKATSDVMMYYP